MGWGAWAMGHGGLEHGDPPYRADMSACTSQGGVSWYFAQLPWVAPDVAAWLLVTATRGQ
jgi:hypothetical protein